MKIAPIDLSTGRATIIFSNVRTFLRCLKITVMLTMLSFTLLSFTFFNETIEKLAVIITGGAGIAFLLALLIASWYRTSVYQVTTQKRNEFMEALTSSISSNHLEMDHITTEVITLKSQVKNIFYSNDHEILIHFRDNKFQIEGYEFLIKRLLKKFPSGIIETFNKY